MSETVQETVGKRAYFDEGSMKQPQQGKKDVCRVVWPCVAAKQHYTSKLSQLGLLGRETHIHAYRFEAVYEVEGGQQCENGDIVRIRTQALKAVDDQKINDTQRQRFASKKKSMFYVGGIDTQRTKRISSVLQAPGKER